MLILVFAIIFIMTAIMPLAATANNSAEEVARLGNAKIAAQKISGGINSIYAAPSQAKTTINIFLDSGSAIECEPLASKIIFRAQMKTNDQYNPKPCSGTETANCCTDGNPIACNGEIAVPTANFTCTFENGNNITSTSDAERKNLQLAITKTAAGTVEVQYAP